MAANYLLGKAERLVKKIPPPAILPSKKHPRSFDDAQARIVPRIAGTIKELSAIHRSACPNDEAVAMLTLHPSYLAKSYFPESLLDSSHLRAVGSRTRVVSPDAWAIKNPPDEAKTVELFVAGKRSDFRRFSRLVATMTESDRSAEDVQKVEDFRSLSIADRLRPARTKHDAPYWEIVLHASALDDSDYILEGFREYLSSLGLDVDLDERLHAQGLCFLPARVPRALIDSVAAFAFLRVAREMPSMRPIARSAPKGPSFKCDLPNDEAIDPNIRVAVFDFGTPELPSLKKWVRRKRTPGLKAPISGLLSHGLGVTSALLFGPIVEGEPLPRPFSNVDHWRVVDKDTTDDGSGQYFSIIKRIMSVLESGHYDFVNFSIGPDMPIEDDDVHVWTALLDQHLAHGKTLAHIAAGNSGEKPHDSPTSRVQTPGDCINAMTVGSADVPGTGWKRSAHSSIGPGRRPGWVKPDAVSFGGSNAQPFYVIGSSGRAEPRIGTSYASPYGLRSAIGVRAHLGTSLSPLALKGLLVHRSEKADNPQSHCGWGRIRASVESLITCEPSTAHIVYQGDFAPGSYLRAPIPLPDEIIKGNVTITATFCFTADTDPQDPLNYSRAGLEVRFRPSDERKKEASQKNANTKTFFNAGNLYRDEQTLRSDAHKWETTLHVSKTLRGSSLRNPVFDIHYNARTAGGKARAPQQIPYVLLVSVHAASLPDIYDRIVRRYRTVLEALQPVVQIPIRR